jgi:hypothetical protein
MSRGGKVNIPAGQTPTAAQRVAKLERNGLAPGWHRRLCRQTITP